MRDEPTGVEGGKVSIRPGVSVLSVLRHLNYRPWFALAEFVDNAIQSSIENREALNRRHNGSFRLKVSISVDTAAPGRITIRDNAAGIPFSSFARAFRPAVLPVDRSGLSEFGMGMKSAACWFSPKWQVRTKAIGDSKERTVKFDIAQIVRDDIEELDVFERPAAPDAHYTEIVLEDLFHIPVGRSLGKIKDHLADIYRVFLREGSLTLQFGTEDLRYEEPPILFAPYYKTPAEPPVSWRKDIDFELGGGQRVSGFAALRDPGNYSRSGFALFRRGRLIEGGGEEGYRPTLIYGTSGSSSYARLRLFGELHLEGFEVSHTKDGFRWDENEEPFLELLREHLDSEDLSLLKQCENFRSLASKKDRTQVANRALNRTGDALATGLPAALPAILDSEPVDTSETPLLPQNTLALREITTEFRGERWSIRIELTDEELEADWISISDQATTSSGLNAIDIRISTAHPFMVSFAQTDVATLEPVLRIAAALAIGEKLARRAGVKNAGTVRRNVNELMREALAKP
jgi:hypothetical protein